MEYLSTLALSSAAIGLTFSVAHALLTLRHRFAHKAREMILKVDGETITIDVSSIEQESPKKLEQAVESVRAAKERDREPIPA